MDLFSVCSAHDALGGGDIGIGSPKHGIASNIEDESPVHKPQTEHVGGQPESKSGKLADNVEPPSWTQEYLGSWEEDEYGSDWELPYDEDDENNENKTIDGVYGGMEGGITCVYGGEYSDDESDIDM